jgi:hypothetical protein
MRVQPRQLLLLQVAECCRWRDFLGLLQPTVVIFIYLPDETNIKTANTATPTMEHLFPAIALPPVSELEPIDNRL